MNKKLIVATGAIGIGTLGAMGLVVPAGLVYAAQNDAQVSTFVQKLAAQLGIDQSKVQTAVDTARTEMRSERITTTKAEITQAVKGGKLTQRQADILNALLDIEQTEGSGQRSENAPKREDLSGLTAAERQAKMQELKSQREQTQVDELNAKGLNTTVAEFESTMTAARDQKIFIGFGGMGMGRGMRW